MSEHWKPGRNRWLSDSDFRALSPAERRRLFAARGQAKRRHGRAGRRTSVRHSWINVVLAGGLTMAAFYSEIGFSLPGIGQAPFAARSAPVSASFGFCHVGGRTNCVVDGDTFYLAGEKIRIADIDAPETHDYGCASELERGQRATRRLQDLLNSGGVQLASIDRDTDVYGRKLRIVEVNGAGVGETLVDEGLARRYAGGRRSWC